MNSSVLRKGVLSIFGATALLVANSAAAEAGFLPVGGMKLVPALGVEYQHDDNIFASDLNPTSSNVTLINPALSLQAETGTTAFDLSYALSKAVYHNSRADDYLDHAVNLDISKEFTARLSSSLAALYNKSHDARGATFTGLAVAVPTPDKYHETGVSGTISYGLGAHVDLTGAYTNKRYDNNFVRTVFRDLDTMGGGISFSLPIMPKTSAVLEARYNRFNYQFFSATTNLDSTEQHYFAGLDWEATAKTEGRVRVGYQRKSFSDAALAGTSGFSWELGVLWSPLTYSTVDITAQSTTGETDGLGSHTENTGGSVSWKHEWNEKFSHTASFSYNEITYVGATARKDKLTTAGIGLDYKLLRWLSLGGGYDYSTRSSNALNTNYNRNQFFVNILATL